MDGKVNKKFYTKNGCFAWACEKDICLDAWFFFLSLESLRQKILRKKSWKAYAWYRKHIKITQNGFFDRAHAFDAVICPLQQFMYPLFFFTFFFNYLSAYFISLLRICSFFHFNFVFQLLWVLRWNSVEKNLFTHASKHTSTHIQKKTLPFFLSFHSIETLSGQRFCPELIIYTWHCNNRSISMND